MEEDILSSVTDDSVSKGLVNMTDSLATDVKTAVDSIVHSNPEHILSMFRRGVDSNVEGVIESFINNLVNLSTNILVSFAVFIVGRWMINRVTTIIKVAVIKRRFERSVRTFLNSVINVVLYALLFLVIVQILGVSTTSLMAMLASAGLALGLALSGTLQNFAGGVMILFLKPYKVGDYITTHEESGTVKDIMLFTTVLETPNRHTIFVPNGSIMSSTIKNATFAENRRVDWAVSISYGDSVELARSVIMEILESDERILRDNSSRVVLNGIERQFINPLVGLLEMGDSSINLTVRAWVEPPDYWEVYFSVYEKIYTTLPQRGITFPFPQVDLNVKSEVPVTMLERQTENKLNK